MLCGSSIPRLRNFSRKTGRRPPSGLQAARDRAVQGDRVDLELEDVLQLDDVRLHPEHLGHVHDATRAVLHPVDVDEQVDAPPRCAAVSPRTTASRSRPSSPSSRCGGDRHAVSWSAPSRANRRDPCSSPGACRAPRRRGTSPTISGRAASAARCARGRGWGIALALEVGRAASRRTTWGWWI